MNDSGNNQKNALKPKEKDISLSTRPKFRSDRHYSPLVVQGKFVKIHLQKANILKCNHFHAE